MSNSFKFFFTSPRGLWQRDKRLKKGLKSQGHEVTVSNSLFSKFSVSQSKLRPLLIRYDSSLLHCLVFLVWMIWDNILQSVILLTHIKDMNDCNVVYAGNTSNYSIFTISVFSKICGKPLVFDPHDGRYLGYVSGRKLVDKDTFSSNLLLALDRNAMDQADVLITESDAQKQKFTEMFDVEYECMCTLYTGAVEENFDRDLYSENIDVGVLYWGTYIEFHKVKLIFDAAQETDENINFVFAGQGNSPKSEQMRADLIRKSKSIQNIEFVGWLPREKLCGYINSCEIALGYFGANEKIRYSVSNTVAEAAYFGKPIITSRSPAITEVFTDGENIIMCEPNSKEEIAEKINEYHSGRNEIKQADVQKIYSDCLSSEKISPKLVSKLENI